MNEPRLKVGRALWEGDVGQFDKDAEDAFARLFGEPFDWQKSLESVDVGDATAFVMPGGFVVFTDTYETNHGIYAPPRRTPEGAVWGLRIEPRADPVVMPIVLPDGYECVDDVRKVYAVRGSDGERHEASARQFIQRDWYGTIYVLSGSEREAERERRHYLRTPKEAVLDAVKDWCDDPRSVSLRDAAERWYFSPKRVCPTCGAVGRVHPTSTVLYEELAGVKVQLGTLPCVECGACRQAWVRVQDMAPMLRDATARLLRYYGPKNRALVKYGSRFLDWTFCEVARNTSTSPDDVDRGETHGGGLFDDASALQIYTDKLIDELEKTW